MHSEGEIITSRVNREGGHGTIYVDDIWVLGFVINVAYDVQVNMCNEAKAKRQWMAPATP